jgi:hypothetical protein
MSDDHKQYLMEHIPIPDHSFHVSINDKLELLMSQSFLSLEDLESNTEEPPLLSSLQSVRTH